MRRLLTSFALVLFPTVVWTVNPDPIPCVEYLETNFFEPSIVNRGLSFYKINQSQWDPIVTQLQVVSQTIPSRMKQRTAGMFPNPIEYPMQKMPTARLLKEVLYQVFMEVMVNNYAANQPQATLVFDYILSKQAALFVNCFGYEVKEILPKFDY